MKKIVYLFSTLLLFILISNTVNAARGDLIYNVDSVSVNNNGITIEGYAFVHRTHNYVKIQKRNDYGSTGEIITGGEDGGQTTIIVVAKCDYINSASCRNNPNNYIKKTYSEDDNGKGYNFYYQQFNGYAPTEFWVRNYNNKSYNKCLNDDSTQCYYEDIGFNITFEYDDLANKFTSNDILSFYIASTNNHYKEETGRDSTDFRVLAVTDIKGSSNSIRSVTNLNSNVYFVAGKAYWRDINNNKNQIKMNIYGCTRPQAGSDFGKESWCEGESFDDTVKNSIYTLIIDNNNNNDNKISRFLYPSYDEITYNGTQFLKDVKSPGFYAFCVYTSGSSRRQDACIETDNNGYCTKCDLGSKLLYAYTSWVEINGDNQLKLKLKNGKKCEVVEPSNNKLECNSSKNYSSICEELTVETDKGNADVKIVQTGNVSSVLTPGTTYAGGGISFGIMYYNTVKWSYISNVSESSELHKAVTKKMNNKIKNYSSYVEGINISNLKLDGKQPINMIKQCTTSNTQKDYYNKELTVSCLFTFPKGINAIDGSVSYDYDVSNISVSNKYYTPINYKGLFEIEANIIGMDRIERNASTNDSISNSPWTGNWDDTFYNCNVNIYDLIMNTRGNYKFMYRPVDIYNPFPNRNAGINWFDWYNNVRNKERLEKSYTDLEYVVTLDNRIITNIKSYNKNNNYLNWDSIDKVTMESSFITENDYIDRVGDN